MLFRHSYLPLRQISQRLKLSSKTCESRPDTLIAASRMRRQDSKRDSSRLDRQHLLNIRQSISIRRLQIIRIWRRLTEPAHRQRERSEDCSFGTFSLLSADASVLGREPILQPTRSSITLSGDVHRHDMELGSQTFKECDRFISRLRFLEVQHWCTKLNKKLRPKLSRWRPIFPDESSSTRVADHEPNDGGWAVPTRRAVRCSEHCQVL